MTNTARLFKFAYRMTGQPLNGKFLADYNAIFSLTGTEFEVMRVIYQRIEDEPSDDMEKRPYVLYDFLRGITELCVLDENRKVILHVYPGGRVIPVE
jgi:hypothetical protein